MAEISIVNLGTTNLSLVFEFGFNGNGILTELSLVYNTTANQEYDQDVSLVFPESGTGPVPFNVDITGLQPFTTYQITVMVFNEAGSSAPKRINATTVSLCELVVPYDTVYMLHWIAPLCVQCLMFP